MYKNLFEKIKAHISFSGPIGIAEYMMLCLYDKDFGYYIRKNPIGKNGDFITAPEISQTFGEMLAIWVISAYHNLGQPQKFRLIELGAGRGTLMADIMRVLDAQKLSNNAQIEIIETNENLRQIQAESLKGRQIIWHEDFFALENNDLPIIIIANEFLDCMPIRQFIKGENHWHERLIGLKDEKLFYGLGPALPAAPINAKNDDAIGTIREIAIGLEAFIEKTGNLLNNNKGQAIFIDYGHYGDSCGDTFQALKAHEKTNPLDNIGECDLTAHVDFGQVEFFAKKHNLSINGPNTQAELLIALGILERKAQLMAQNPQKAPQIEKAIKRLIDQDAMGDLFKAIIIST